MKRTPLRSKSPLKRKTSLKKGNGFSQLKRKPMKQVSDKRKVDEKEYARLRKAFLKDRCACQPCQHEFMKGLRANISFSSQVHHMAKRGKHYLNIDTWLPVCAEHHAEIEGDRAWAEDMGYTYTVSQIRRLG